MADNITTKIGKNGYVYQYVSLRGWVLQHRLIMAEKLGRPLERTEVVHHINHDRTDNRLENLELFGWVGDHSRHHNTLQRWSRHHDKCIHCGTTGRPHHGKGLCSLCARRKRHGNLGTIYYEWSWHYPACVICGQTDSKHMAKGKCVRCYLRERKRLGLR